MEILFILLGIPTITIIVFFYGMLLKTMLDK